MKYEWFGFNQEVACELNLNIEELAALRWFVDFKGTEGMKEYIDENNNVYYWINYKYFARECPIFFKDKNKATDSSIRNKVNRLFSNGLSKVLEKKVVRITSSDKKGKIGTEIYFKLIPETYKMLISSHRSKMSDGKFPTAQKCDMNITAQKCDMIKPTAQKCDIDYSININSSINDSSINSDFEKSQDIKEDQEEIIKKIIKLYPGTKTKSVRDKKLPKIIKEHGAKEILEAVTRYAKIVEGKEKQFILNESTFWNGRYIDYLTENYEEPKTGGASKREYKTNVPNKFNNFEPREFYSDPKKMKTLEEKLLGWDDKDSSKEENESFGGFNLSDIENTY